MTEVTTQQVDVGVLVDQYVRLRDRIKEVDDAHKEKMRPAKDHLEALNNKLLCALNDLGGESIKTAAGTAYRTEKASASIAEPEAFRNYVISQRDFDMLDWKANAPAVRDFIAEHKEPPPGVKFTTAYVVGVRRA